MAPMNNDLSVQVHDLSRIFGDFTAVDHINLEIRKGEIFGFLGPNGAGKSTTIKMLTGLLQPSSGRGTVGGFDIMTESEEIKRNIGYMSQKFSLYDDLTVEENIDFFSGIYAVPARRKQERKQQALAIAGLAEMKDRLTRSLPAGFKQRLALGCAVLHEPLILFLDEPTSGVDPVSRRNFWDRIHGMADSGTTVFVTTHYMDEADYCDRLGLIYRGRIIAEGTPDELKREFMKRDVIEIEVDRIVEAADILNGNRIEAAIFGSALHATVNSAETSGPAIRKILEDAGIAVGKVEEMLPSLEDVFVTLIETA